MRKKRSSNFTLNLLGIGTAIALLGDATLYTVLPHPDTSAQLGITLSMVGLLLGANRAVRLLLNGPVGILYDRAPRRGLLVSALFLGAISSVFYAVGFGVWPLLMGRIFWGLAWSLLWVGGNSVVLDLSTEQNRGQNSGIYLKWFYIGIAFASLIGAFLTDLVGFRAGQWISAAVIAGTAFVWLFFLPETRTKPTTTTPDNEKSEISTGLKLPWKMIAASSLTIFITRLLAWGVLAATAILWLSDLFGDGLRIFQVLIPIASLTGLFTALSNMASVGSTRLAGTISDRLGRRWLVIGMASLLGGAGLWMMSGDLLGLALIGGFLVPLASSSSETMIPALTGDRVPKQLRSRVLGLITTAGDLGATIGPIAALGALNAGWITLGGIYRIGGVLFGLVALLSLSPLTASRNQVQERRN